MRVLFIYPDMITRDPLWQGYYYEGIALLSAVARAASHDTKLLHVWRPMSPEQVLEVKKGESTLTLVIDRPGLVDIEEHESGMVLLQLEVR